ncbi:DUF4249 domain-containing protein [Gramella lutea]|uniref:DUF4249 domain-containing protein n=1 Tax=Christiangramia lutea TaxID=1607951 RepID=A0A9X1V3P0_9FLAO|nr:DUF4249 domain-containing protein [Christiangramia lutea]MCH4822284.1 DUF4249 domain-containing protein [Christiangramia lutea]
MKVFKDISLKLSFFAGILLLLTSCVEELELDTENFESILIVEAVITDEVKIQEIKINRSYRLEENGPSEVSDAVVSIESSNGEDILFYEASPGIYLSEVEFSAVPGTEYTLEVATENSIYRSSTISGQESTGIDEVRTTKTNLRGRTGVAILVSSSDENQGSFYKYLYEETYKIVSPYEKLWDLIINEEGDLEVIEKTREEYICYNTQPSEELIISGTNELSENNINDYLVKFIARDNYKMSWRYSMLVKQMKISADAHAFYATLKKLSEADNIFSQYQPGLLNGNVQAVEGNAEKVIGVFSAAAVDEARVFFSYTDYFDPIVEQRASHLNDCEEFTDTHDILKELISEGEVKFFAEEPPDFPATTYFVISAPCVDCNYFGTNVQPDFWIE